MSGTPSDEVSASTLGASRPLTWLFESTEALVNAAPPALTSDDRRSAIASNAMPSRTSSRQTPTPPRCDGGHRQRHLDERRRLVGIGVDLDRRFRVGGERQVRGRRRLRPRRQRLEALDDRLLDVVDVDVADDDQRRVVGSIPVVVEAPERLRRHRLDRLRRADRVAALVGGAGEEQPLDGVEHPALRVLVGTAPLVEHHAPLLLDRGRVEGRGRQPLGQHVEPGRHDLVVVGGDRELVHGLVVAACRR